MWKIGDINKESLTTRLNIGIYKEGRGQSTWLSYLNCHANRGAEG